MVVLIVNDNNNNNTLNCSHFPHCHFDVTDSPHTVCDREECQILKDLLLCFALCNSDDHAMHGMRLCFFILFYFQPALLKHSNCIV